MHACVRACVRVIAHMWLQKSASIFAGRGYVWVMRAHMPFWQELTKQLETAGISVQKIPPFQAGEFHDTADQSLGEIRRSGFRIVVLSSQMSTVVAVSLDARAQGMTKGYAWVYISVTKSYGSTEGPELGAELRAKLKPQFTKTFNTLRTNPEIVVGWLSIVPFSRPAGLRGFSEQVAAHSDSFNVSLTAEEVDLPYASTLYEAIMLYAHAASKTLSRGGDLHDGEAVTKALRSTSFIGIEATNVTLDQDGDRILSNAVLNFKPGTRFTLDDVGDIFSAAVSGVMVGFYNSTLGKYKAEDHAVVWPGRTLEAPLDYVAGEGKHCPPGLV